MQEIPESFVVSCNKSGSYSLGVTLEVVLHSQHTETTGKDLKAPVQFPTSREQLGVVDQ